MGEPSIKKPDLIHAWSMRPGEKTNLDEPAADSSSKLRRIDARRNRARIFTAAKKLFAEQSGSARMEDIARLAGVGVGSLYRSFGNRAGLAEAIFRDILDDLVEMANRLGLDRDPCSALRIWLQTYIDGLPREAINAWRPRPAVRVRSKIARERPSQGGIGAGNGSGQGARSRCSAIGHRRGRSGATHQWTGR